MVTINEFDKRIVKGIVTMMGTIIPDTLDTEEQIEEAKASLDRINGWINGCDSKAGTVLALTGVLLTIIFTNYCVHSDVSNWNLLVLRDRRN